MAQLTWVDRVNNLRRALGRDPTLDELLEVATIHIMTPEEYQAMRSSFVRGMLGRCEHGVLDFEQCPQCRKRLRPSGS